MSMNLGRKLQFANSRGLPVQLRWSPNSVGSVFGHHELSVVERARKQPVVVDRLSR